MIRFASCSFSYVLIAFFAGLQIARAQVTQVPAADTNLESRYCSIINATGELIALNKTELLAGSKHHSLRLQNNKVAVISIHKEHPVNEDNITQTETYEYRYAAPVRLVRDNFVADFARSTLLGIEKQSTNQAEARMEVTPLSFTKTGLFIMRELTRIVTTETSGSHAVEILAPSLEFIPKAGGKDILGDIVVRELNQYDPTMIVIKLANGKFQTVQLKTGTQTPFENQAVIDVLKLGFHGAVSRSTGAYIFFPKNFTGQGWQEFYHYNPATDQVARKLRAQLDYTNMENPHFKTETGEILALQEGFSWSNLWNADQNSVFGFQSMNLQLLKYGKRIGTPIQFTSMGLNTETNGSQFAQLRLYQDGKNYLISAAKINCAAKPSQILTTTETATPLASGGPSVLQKIGGPSVCAVMKDDPETFDQHVGLTPALVLSKEVITEFEADYLLQRFLRQDSLSKQDKSAIELIVRNKVGLKFSNLIFLILAKFDLQKKYPGLKFLSLIQPTISSFSGNLAGICASPMIRTTLSGAFKEQIMARLKKEKELNPTSFNIQNLLFIKGYLPMLTEQHKADIASDSGTLLAEASVAYDSTLRNVFFSTLDWMATQNARQVLGLKFSQLTDFITSANLFNGHAEATILGTADILADDSFVQATTRRARGGFFTLNSYVSHYQNYNNGQGAFNPDQKTLRWYMDQKPFEVDLIKVTRPLEYTPTLVSEPNRDELLADKILYGMVVIGANIRGESLIGVKEHYLYYLETQGFEFHEEVIDEDSVAYIQDRIIGRNEKLDYFLKEAHSDGDHRNLFSLNKKMHRIRAERLGDSHKDIIDLIFHDDSYNPVFIANQDFGNWLKTRESEKNAGQFIYLNTSCSSYMKAAAELGTSASKNLVVIASADSVFTFSTNETNSTYHLFEGMLNLTPFDQIIERSKGLTGEYIFPHQEKYKDLVLSRINAGFDLISKIYRIAEDGTRTLFQIEQEINHVH